jgi:hypothetical protein
LYPFSTHATSASNNLIRAWHDFNSSYIVAHAAVQAAHPIITSSGDQRSESVCSSNHSSNVCINHLLDSFDFF